MRAESAGANTWLLAAVAGWALCVWTLGLFGLGGRIEARPEDPSLLQRLPQPAQPLPERLGPLAQYSEIGTRPLFSDNRQPQPFLINPDGESEQANTFDFVLTSVLLTPQLQMAIVQPNGGGEPVRLKIGEAPDAAPSWALASISPRSVVFNGPEGEKTLELRVFDGTGGQAPTPITTPPPSAAGGAPRAVAMPNLQPPPPSPSATAKEVSTNPTPEQQAEAIRKRIEERRAQLQQEAQRQAAQPTKTP